jgi:hypothetical protein
VTKALELWLKADDGLARNGATWADRSGHAHDATSYPDQAPTVMRHGLNGLPVAVFGGHQVMGIAGQILDSQEFTIIAVVSDKSTPGAQGYREILSNWSTGTTVSSVFLGTIWYPIDTKTTDRIRFTDAIGGADQGQTGQGNIHKPSHAFVLTATSTASDACVYVNTRKAYCLGAPLPTRDLSQPFVIGRQGANFDNEYWVGDMAEILVYDKALSASQRNTDITYLAAKWGISTP